MKKLSIITIFLVCCAAGIMFGANGDKDSANAYHNDTEKSVAELARRLQDPLANIAAIMTDNNIQFNKGGKKNSYSFQIQPVKSFNFPEKNFSLIARGIIPIVGIAPENSDGGGHTWGLADITTQFFIAPKTDRPWKWGLGPQLSWKTRTNEKLRGPGWGGGPHLDSP